MKFDAAVALAESKIKEYTKSVSANEYNRSLYIKFSFENDIAEYITDIVAASEVDQRYWDGLVGYCVSLLNDGVLPPLAMRAWAVEVLSGARERPKVPAKFRRGHPEDLDHRNFLLWLVISELVSSDMAATRNDASPPFSACDAVATAMSRLKMRPASFKEIKAIYMKYERERRHWHESFSIE